MHDDLPSPPHPTAESFRDAGHRLVDWVADYLETLEDRPVREPVEPGAIRALLPDAAPEHGESLDAILDDLDRIVVPGLLHWQHPRFFGWFPANASYPAILGELASAGLGVQGMSWETSPAATEVEVGVLEWLRVLLGLPDRFGADGAGGAVIQDSASSATLCALLAARERGRASTPEAPLFVYTSDQAHASVDKALHIAGFGPECLRTIPVDGNQAMRPDALADAMDFDEARRGVPCAVVATVGTTSTGAVDPVAAIAEVAARHGAWVHVDAAWAGPAAIAPEHRWLHDGLETVDSYCTNPHKWMLVNFDCDVLWVADRTWLLRALSTNPAYLRNEASDSGAVVDFRDWQIPLGRRFRALKLWFTLRAYGAEGIRAHIRRHVAWATELALLVTEDPNLELAALPSLSLVCVAHREGDAATDATLAAVNASGRTVLTRTEVAGRSVIRIAIGGARTEARHVDELWALLSEEAARATDGS